MKLPWSTWRWAGHLLARLWFGERDPVSSGSSIWAIIFSKRIHRVKEDTSDCAQCCNVSPLPHGVCLSERHNHARELARDADLSQWDAFVIISGDGLLFEVRRDTCTQQDEDRKNICNLKEKERTSNLLFSSWPTWNSDVSVNVGRQSWFWLWKSSLLRRYWWGTKILLSFW